MYSVKKYLINVIITKNGTVQFTSWTLVITQATVKTSSNLSYIKAWRNQSHSLCLHFRNTEWSQTGPTSWTWHEPNVGLPNVTSCRHFPCPIFGRTFSQFITTPNNKRTKKRFCIYLVVLVRAFYKMSRFYYSLSPRKRQPQLPSMLAACARVRQTALHVARPAASAP